MLLGNPGMDQILPSVISTRTQGTRSNPLTFPTLEIRECALQEFVLPKTKFNSILLSQDTKRLNPVTR